MPDVPELRRRLLAAQNADGGWAFQAPASSLSPSSPRSSSRSSWTEPTSLALLALQSLPSPATTEALSWLLRHQNPDGGWPPTPNVPTSTWVTSLAALALPHTPSYRKQLQSAATWLTHAIYPPETPFQQLLSAVGLPPAKAPGGVPWFPGTAGWVAPTAFNLLALSRLDVAPSSLHQCQSYLLSHRCPDGGWNHGGSLSRSETSTSYPETTGLALLALAHSSAAELLPALQLGDRFLRNPESSEGFSWIQLGLLAHGRPIEPPTHIPKPRTARDLSLALLALAASQGCNPFLQAA